MSDTQVMLISRAKAMEIAQDAVDRFGDAQPSVTMSWNQWMDLREIIERTIMGYDP